MEKALNSKGKMVDIIESIREEKYTCPVCGLELSRKFGNIRRYFAHPKGEGDDCEIKLKNILKQQEQVKQEITSADVNILSREYYNKKFDNVKIELSNYICADGNPATQEQYDIIFAKEDNIIANAAAGAAKTTTSFEKAKNMPDNRILYLVYNRAAADEAKETFGKLPYVTVKTVHGLAHGQIGVYKLYSHKLLKPRENYNAKDALKDLNLEWDKLELAHKTLWAFGKYLNSNLQTFDELNIFIDEDGKEDEMKLEIIKNCKKLWSLKKDYNNNVKIEPDFYLKMFQLSKKDLSSQFDMIILDEAQDSNLVTLDILINAKVRKNMIIGDPFQQLYGWRDAVNIMPLFKKIFSAKEYNLTTSFRVSQQIANIANILLQDIGKVDFGMTGWNEKQKIVESIDREKKHAVLCRTNAYILKEVITVLEINPKARLFFEGGYDNYKFEDIKDCYWFSKGKQVDNKKFSKHGTYGQMREYATKVNDIELLVIIKMVNDYDSRIPEIVDNVKKNVVYNKQDADVILTTVHKSKGQTYKMPIVIADDHFDIWEVFEKYYIKKEEKFKLEKFFEEMCILYVAITRCAREIELSSTLKRYLVNRYEYMEINNKD